MTACETRPACHYCQQQGLEQVASQQLCGLWTCANCLARILAVPFGVWRILCCMRSGIKPAELPT